MSDDRPSSITDSGRPQTTCVPSAWSQLRVDRGDPLPLGMHECRSGVNLAVFSRHATRMSLLLFDNRADLAAGLTIELDPRTYRTGDIWHVRLTGTPAVAFYALKAAGTIHRRLSRSHHARAPSLSQLTSRQ